MAQTRIAPDPLVVLAAGAVRGRTTAGITAFHGLPFAAPPVGERRFRAPEPPPPWPGVRDASVPGPIAPQVRTPLERLYGRPAAQDEDCLTLSVWTPAIDDGCRPVVVWLHGGNFVNGSGCTPRTDGAAMARQGDVVVVGVNYRLGALGYLHLGDLVEDEADSGCLGLLDQVAALRWVKDEIAAFGGDPGRVTVVGESAGAMSVGALLGTPAADGLFRRAVMQSGGPSGVRSRTDATAIAVELLDQLGLPPDPGGIASLRAVPVERLLAAQAGVAGRVWRDARTTGAALGIFGPVFGTDALPRHPVSAISSRTWIDALLVGTTADEMRIITVLDQDFYERSEEVARARLRAVFGERTDLAERVYLTDADSPADALVRLDGDQRFLVPTQRVADLFAERGVPTWTYEFGYRSTAFGGALRSAHGVEVPFVFDTLDTDGARALAGEPTAASRRLAHAMCLAWTSFAWAGSPNHPGMPPWPSHDAERRPTMIFDEELVVLDDPAGERRRLWEGLDAGPRNPR